jgi:single-stranded DNA-binding protein
VFVEGRFRTRQFEGRDGQTRTALEITADSIVNLEKRGRDEDGSFGGGEGSFAGATATRPSAPQRAGGDDTELDDLPF